MFEELTPEKDDHPCQMVDLVSLQAWRLFIGKSGEEVPGSATDCQQEMGSKLHWPVQPIQPIIPFPVVNLWPNRVIYYKMDHLLEGDTSGSTQTKWCATY